eukprot:TRINITY_DN3037_c0_g1_i1.p1 TRINITY_DN3037_c0_g1~~TRINITY_DN3037_c0_g1_i1.p1  ORF type:complete len:1876 (+),score=191.90 TRINITY_DN3037_c0_g1_i1:93-5720(+)
MLCAARAISMHTVKTGLVFTTPTAGTAAARVVTASSGSLATRAAGRRLSAADLVRRQAPHATQRSGQQDLQAGRQPQAPPDSQLCRPPRRSPLCRIPVSPSVSPTPQPTRSPTKNPTERPTTAPTFSPTVSPTKNPSTSPTVSPSVSPTNRPTVSPTLSPTTSPTVSPTTPPTTSPTVSPTNRPTSSPTVSPTTAPTFSPTVSPSISPTESPTNRPTVSPTVSPSTAPTVSPTVSPSLSPTESPTNRPTVSPTVSPTLSPTMSPTTSPTLSPTVSPTNRPTLSPTTSPSVSPTWSPTASPTFSPTVSPTDRPTVSPTVSPSGPPSVSPTFSPSFSPTVSPTYRPTLSPTAPPTRRPTVAPSASPSANPTLPPTERPTTSPSAAPSEPPTATPSDSPSLGPTIPPTENPTLPPSTSPTSRPTVSPTSAPTTAPTVPPSRAPSVSPTTSPTFFPTVSPSLSPSAPPTVSPSPLPSTSPTASPSRSPTTAPSPYPSFSPTVSPSLSPTVPPSLGPTSRPTAAPTFAPTVPPSVSPTLSPSDLPSPLPTTSPTGSPSLSPSAHPTESPSRGPSTAPSVSPTWGPWTSKPTAAPSAPPTANPSSPPTASPTWGPWTSGPTAAPLTPSMAPTSSPNTSMPSQGPSAPPSPGPSATPSAGPSAGPTYSPAHPTPSPTGHPSREPSRTPTSGPTLGPDCGIGVTTGACAALGCGWSIETGCGRCGARVQRADCEAAGCLFTAAGTCEACTPLGGSRTEAECSGHAGCHWDPEKATCGSSFGCAAQAEEADCHAGGCGWSAVTAPGTCTSCATVGAHADCQTLGGCGWHPATGSCTGCAGLNITVCAKHSGCMWDEEVPDGGTQPTGCVKRPPDPPKMGGDEAKAVADTAAVVGVAAGPAPGMAMIALLADDPCGKGEEDTLSMVLHPLQFKVFDSIHAGCVVGNTSILAFFALVAVLAELAARPLLARMGRNPDDITAITKQPGGMFVLLLMLHQGSTYCSARLLLHTDDISMRAGLVGTAGMLGLVIGVPLSCWMFILRPLPSHAAYQLDRRRPLLNFFIGPGEWIHLGNRWYERFGSVVKQYRPPNAQKAVLAQFLETSATSIVRAIQKKNDNTCGPIIMFFPVIFLLHGYFIYKTRPYARPRDTVYEALITLCLTVSMTLMAIQYFNGNPDDGWALGGAKVFFTLSMLVLLVKLVLDMLTELRAIKTGRRRRLQAAFESGKWALATMGEFGQLPRREGYDFFLPVAKDPEPAEAPSECMTSRYPGEDDDSAKNTRSTGPLLFSFREQIRGARKYFGAPPATSEPNQVVRESPPPAEGGSPPPPLEVATSAAADGGPSRVSSVRLTPLPAGRQLRMPGALAAADLGGPVRKLKLGNSLVLAPPGQRQRGKSGMSPGPEEPLMSPASSADLPIQSPGVNDLHAAALAASNVLAGRRVLKRANTEAEAESPAEEMPQNGEGALSPLVRPLGGTLTGEQGALLNSITLPGFSYNDSGLELLSPGERPATGGGAPGWESGEEAPQEEAPPKRPVRGRVATSLTDALGAARAMLRRPGRSAAKAEPGGAEAAQAPAPPAEDPAAGDTGQAARTCPSAGADSEEAVLPEPAEAVDVDTDLAASMMAAAQVTARGPMSPAVRRIVRSQDVLPRFATGPGKGSAPAAADGLRSPRSLMLPHKPGPSVGGIGGSAGARRGPLRPGLPRSSEMARAPTDTNALEASSRSHRAVASAMTGAALADALESSRKLNLSRHVSSPAQRPLRRGTFRPGRSPQQRRGSGAGTEGDAGLELTELPPTRAVSGPPSSGLDGPAEGAAPVETAELAAGPDAPPSTAEQQEPPAAAAAAGGGAGRSRGSRPPPRAATRGRGRKSTPPIRPTRSDLADVHN